MRKVKRLEKPEILQKHEKKWVKKIQIALKGSKKNLELATNKYKHEEIKKQLQNMFLGKCAYCESKYIHVGFGDIEHFRPRSKFPLLAVKWTNLLLSCGRCNSSGVKGDKFPRIKLINPCIDNPDEHFLFSYDEYIGIANVSGITPGGIITEQILQLNRDDLRNNRSLRIKQLLALAKYYAESGDIEAKNLLEQAIDDSNPDAEYLAFTKTIKQKMAIPP
jgi:uncharacterized protein (TIGR02646 family)